MWLCWDHNALHYAADLNQQVACLGHDTTSVFHDLIWAQGESSIRKMSAFTRTLVILWWGRETEKKEVGQQFCENMICIVLRSKKKMYMKLQGQKFSACVLSK